MSARWPKNPELRTRPDGQHVLVVGTMIYRFDRDGLLQSAEPLTEALLVVLTRGGPGAVKDAAIAQAAAKLRKRNDG